MPPFRRVEPDRAGPGALGILIPPGKRSIIILRPRALAWDLLPTRWDGDPARPPRFCTFSRDEAALVVRRIFRFLEEQVRAVASPVRTVGDAADRHFQIWLTAEDLVWIPCRRTSGQAYQPVLFMTREEAVAAAEALEKVVWPAADAGQEVYFNTQLFA